MLNPADIEPLRAAILQARAGLVERETLVEAIVLAAVAEGAVQVGGRAKGGSGARRPHF